MITLKFWLLLTMALIVAEAQDFVCKKGKQKGKGKTITIDNGVSYSFKTQAGATYAPNTKCFVTYKRKQASCPMIMFTCSEFNIRNKKASCKSGDKMMIKEDKKKPKSYCQQVGPDVATSAAKLKVFFISKKRSRASGAVCTVSCYEEPTTDDPTEPTTTESETTTATGEEPVSMTNEPTTTGQERCDGLTPNDQEGPFFVANVPQNYKIAPEETINDAEQAAIIKGKVLDKNCDPLEGALVEIWYAGENPAIYTFRPDTLYYRGYNTTSKTGSYEFSGSYPTVYDARPIRHIHYKVSAKGTEFVTQAYFKGSVPPSYEDYVLGREKQFVNMEVTSQGRMITFDVVMNI